MRKIIVGLLSVIFATQVTAQVTKYNLLFELNQKQLTAEQKKEIDSLSHSIKDGALLTIYPLIYDSFCDCLGFLKNARIQASEIANYAGTIGFEVLGTPSNFPSGYRGVSVGVNLKYNKPKEIIAVVEEPGQLIPYGLKDHYPPKASQFFVINPNKDNTIVGEEGTKLFFKAGSLISTKDVRIELKEFYSMEDYMKNGIPTVSNGVMIETGGSVYLNATKNEAQNQQVKINPDIGVEIEFTLGKEDSNMQVFVKDPRSTGDINWILPPQQKVIKTWVMTETTYDEKGRIISQEKFTSKEAWEKHLKERKRQEELQKLKREAEEEIRKKMANALRIFEFGYINCDRFYSEPMIPLIVSADDKILAEYYLVYDDVRGVMKGYVDNKQVSFGQVPENRKATLIAVSFFDNQAYYYDSTLIINKNVKPQVLLKAVDESFLAKQLSLLK